VPIRRAPRRFTIEAAGSAALADFEARSSARERKIERGSTWVALVMAPKQVGLKRRRALAAIDKAIPKKQ
jgi:hypothetical protein